MSRVNYFNSLSMSSKLDQLGRCRFMQRSEFANGIAKIAKKKIVIVGCTVAAARRASTRA